MTVVFFLFSHPNASLFGGFAMFNYPTTQAIKLFMDS